MIFSMNNKAYNRDWVVESLEFKNLMLEGLDDYKILQERKLKELEKSIDDIKQFSILLSNIE